MARKLYVGNPPCDTDEQASRPFGTAGTVETVSVMRDMATGARGFAFVEMASDEDAQKAISMLNDRDLGGRNPMVNEARPSRRAVEAAAVAAAATAVVARNSRRLSRAGNGSSQPAVRC